MPRKILYGGVAGAVIAVALFAVVSGADTTKGEWPVYGGDKASRKYSPLDQINPGFPF